MKNSLVFIAAALMACVAANAIPSHNVNVTNDTKLESAGSLGAYRHFEWYLLNASDYTISNIYVSHQASSADNAHNIATLAPHSRVGPFWGDWYSGSPDFWRLSFWAQGIPFWNNSKDGFQTRKQCSVEWSDLDAGQPITVTVFGNDKPQHGEGVNYFTPSIKYGMRGFIHVEDGFAIQMPPNGSSSCSALMSDRPSQ